MGMGRKKVDKSKEPRVPLGKRLKQWLSQRWFTLTVLGGILAAMLFIRSLDDLRRWWDANPDRQLAAFVISHDGSLVAAGSEKRIDDHAGVPFGRFAIREVSLSAAGLRDEQISLLSERRDIEVVDVSINPLTDAAIKTLRNMSSLHKLNLTRTYITASGVARLQRQFPKCDITAPANDNFCQWALETGTAKSVVVEVDLSSRGTRGRRRCTTLKELPTQALTVIEADFGSVMTFDDEAALHLEGLGSIELLGLDGTAITDGAIDVLMTLKSLRRLNIAGTKMTDAGVARLREELAGVELSH